MVHPEVELTAFFVEVVKLKAGLSMLKPGFRRGLWWRFMPGVVIKVRWPTGETRIKQGPSGIWDYVKSADPNDHYRPWLENHVGRQGWDWDWTVSGNDLSENTVTIKFKKGKEYWATVAALKWS